MKKNKHLFLFVIYMIFAMPVITAHAENQLEDLPKVEILTKEDFLDKSRLVEENFPNYQNFSFRMNVPEDLRILPQDQLINEMSGNGVEGTIFQAIGPATNAQRPYIKVTAHHLKRLVSVKNWFIGEVFRLGYTLKAIEADDNKDDFDAFYVRLDKNGNTEIVRGRGFLNGDQVVLVEYSIPVVLWRRDRDKQIMSVQSFEFLNDYDVVSPEAMQKYRYLDSFETEYPKSWLLKADPSTKVNDISFELKTADEAGFLIAEINLDILSTKSLRDRLDKTTYPLGLVERLKMRRQEIFDEGYDLGDHTTQDPIPLQFDNSLNITEIYPLRRRQSGTYMNIEQSAFVKEYWVTVIRRPDDIGISYIVTMIAPNRENNFVDWAIAKDTYRHIIQSIR